MIQIDINMPIGCIYEGDNGKTEYCPLCNHDDVPYCQYLDDDEAALGIDERPCYCPLYKSEPQWIPCANELPKVGDYYLVTGKQKWSNQKEWEYFTDVAIFDPPGAYIDDCWTTWNDWIEGQETHIIAWAKMPEPYKGD